MKLLSLSIKKINRKYNTISNINICNKILYINIRSFCSNNNSNNNNNNDIKKNENNLNKIKNTDKDLNNYNTFDNYNKPNHDDSNILIDILNKIIEDSPIISLMTFTSSTMLTWMAFVGLYSQLFSFGPEYITAYIVARLTNKFRFPFDIFLSGIIVKNFPFLSKFKIASIILPTYPGPDVKLEDNFSKFMNSINNSIKEPIDKYGLSYIVARKINIFVLISSTIVTVKYGLDISYYLQFIGLDEAMLSGSGALAVATLSNFFLMPLHIGSLIFTVPLITAYIKKLKN